MINSPYTINIGMRKGQFDVSIRSEWNTPRQSVCLGICQQVDFSNPEQPKQRDRNIYVKPAVISELKNHHYLQSECLHLCCYYHGISGILISISNYFMQQIFIYFNFVR